MVHLRPKSRFFIDVTFDLVNQSFQPKVSFKAKSSAGVSLSGHRPNGLPLKLD